ncbi:UDP-3-O-(3-hydroxymyristoyl)glucosamine N-acyltransferase [candidate division KSB1 bacterium]|nr:UDP-3-O-(3-hydroxymyristoyl)glucosamine N-acyltransferase [candidate division KSB1 bacterium]
MHVTLAEIAQWLNGAVEGDDSVEIFGLAKIEEAQSGHLTFIANPKYAKYLDQTRASAVLVAFDFPPCDKNIVRVQDPYYSFLILAKKFYHKPCSIPAGIHKTAVIGKNVKMGDNTAVGANVVIGDGCILGDDVILHPGVVIGDHVVIGEKTVVYANVTIREECRIGSRVIIHMGAVIGSDGFGFVFHEGKYQKLPQMGIVVLGDDVEIGANTTIDRATMGETVIKNGVKIDNLVQVAHNVVIGEHTAIAAQTGISGSTKIGKLVRIGGQAGLAGHIQVGDEAVIGGQAGVTKSVDEKIFVSGYPARPHFQARREEASLGRLPGLLRRIKQLEEEVQSLKKK